MGLLPHAADYIKKQQQQKKKPCLLGNVFSMLIGVSSLEFLT